MYAQLNNHKIHYTTEGKGKALVLLHGFTESLDIWKDFSASLSKIYQVICIDLPGHGKSDYLGEIHSMESMAEIVKKVIDVEKITECVICGHSMGGYVTLSFAEKYPKYIKGLCLFHSTAFEDTEEGKAKRAKAIEIIEKNHQSFICSFIPDLFAPSNRKLLEKEINILIENARNMSKQAIIASQQGMMERKNMLHILENADYPVLFIAGKQDTRIPFEKITDQIILPKVSYSLLLHNAAHMGYLEDHNRTLSAIKHLLEESFKVLIS